MLINWLLYLLIPFWAELILNPATGKPSGKSLFAALSFVVGIGGSVTSIVADIAEHRPVEKSAILLLLANGSLLAGLKVYQGQMNRETKTPEGNALAEPGVNPPKLMPQPEGETEANHPPAAE